MFRSLEVMSPMSVFARAKGAPGGGDLRMDVGGWRETPAATLAAKDWLLLRERRPNLLFEGLAGGEAEGEVVAASKAVSPLRGASESLKTERVGDCALTKEALETTEAEEGSLVTVGGRAIGRGFGFLTVLGEDGGEIARCCPDVWFPVGPELPKGSVQERVCDVPFLGGGAEDGPA